MGPEEGAFLLTLHFSCTVGSWFCFNVKMHYQLCKDNENREKKETTTDGRLGSLVPALGVHHCQLLLCEFG